MDRELMQETTALYALAPEEFTKARNARAKELKPDQADLAARVAKLAKPSAAAAAINHVARDDPSEVRALVQAGRALRSAQEAALSGKSGGEVSDATREHRAALERVLREARRLRLSGAVLERVASTLRAASIDPELQPLLERGLLAREVEAAGFGLDPGLAAAVPPRKGGGKRKSDDGRRKSDDGKRKSDDGKRKLAVQAARERLTEAKRVAGDAERERKRLARELEAAAKAVERAAASVAKAERELDDLRPGP